MGAYTIRSFHKKSLTLKALLHCCYGFSKISVELFEYLLVNGPADLKKLSTVFQRDESTIYRHLQPLIEEGLVRICSQKMEIGRPRNVYCAITKSELVKKLKRLTEDWYKRVMKFIENLEFK
ncbi:MAG: helix-turn-helix domain-containing protein [Candidatus Asgardarchaeia archaeon]